MNNKPALMVQIENSPTPIPEYELRLLAKAIIDYAERFYADPENQRHFEEWQAAQDSAATAQEKLEKIL